MGLAALSIAEAGAVLMALGFVIELLAGDAGPHGVPNKPRRVSEWAVAVGFCLVVVFAFLWADTWMLEHAS